MKKLFCVALFVLAGAVQAQEMRCGNGLIEGDQMQPMTTDEVEEVCGEPNEIIGYEWFYHEQGKVLVFNGNNELETIRDRHTVEDAED
jgi:hypothetical protein